MTIKHILCVFLVLAFFACGEEPPPPAPVPSAPVAKAPEPAPEPEKSEAVEPKRSWPYNVQAEVKAQFKHWKLALPRSDNMLAKNFVIIFDDSGSMKDTECQGQALPGMKMTIAKKAIKNYINMLPDGVNIGVVTFHQGMISLVNLTSDTKPKIQAAVENLGPGGRTPLSGAFDKAFMLLSAQALAQQGYGTYRIVCVTDGDPTDTKGSKDELESLRYTVDTIIEKGPAIQVYTTGFCIGDNHPLNQANQTHYSSASDPEQLRASLAKTTVESKSFDASVSFQDLHLE